MTIEEIPNDATLNICRNEWNLANITFVRNENNF